MLTFEQLIPILQARNQAGTLFSTLDKTPFEHIISFCEHDPEVDKALLYAADARKEAVAALLAMLEADPYLLLQAGNVKTPGGLEVQRVTIYEFVLGAGDLDLAGTITPFFARMPGGETERLRQLERYRPHLDRMLTQVPYNIQPIFDLLLDPANRAAIRNDVRALLTNDPAHKSQLRDALSTFREDHLPKFPLIKPRMHFNYATQNKLYQMLYDDVLWSKLYEASGNNDDMINLVWRQMIGYLMNFYPGIDRCLAAQGLFYAFNADGTHAEANNRSYKLRGTNVDFPAPGSDVAGVGVLGDHFGISIFAGASVECVGGAGDAGSAFFQSLCLAKASKLPSIYAATPAKPAGCVIP